MKKRVLTPCLSLALLAPCAAQTGHPAGPIEPVMVTIPAGQFLMGNATPSPYQPGSPSDGPQHKVALKAFKLSKYELTVKEYRQFVVATNYVPAGSAGQKETCWKWVKPAAGGSAITMAEGRWNTPAYAPGDYHPVMCVSWDDAQAYVQWLSKRTGKQYRLPSESEWEYAARAGNPGRFASGDDATAMCRVGNVWDQSGKRGFLREFGWDRKDGDCDDQAEFTTVVGMYEANAFGLHDMFGNVGEYVEDCQHKDYAGAPADGSAWKAGCDAMGGEVMVIHRGGSYGTRGDSLRFSGRSHAGQSNQSSLGEGIRIAQTIVLGTEAGEAPNPFEAELAQAHKAERARRAAGASR
jgi:formylglycine-generating enzyme required for sulfatase activity